jgi:pimeloyl-ACP methyl ester carboxylesterase
LVIHDRQDREVPIAEGRRHLRNWPHARLMETSGLGHSRMLNDPSVISVAVDFIAGGRP